MLLDAPLLSNGLKNPLLPSPRVLFLTWMISVIPFTAPQLEQGRAAARTGIGMGLRRKRWGISQTSALLKKSSKGWKQTPEAGSNLPGDLGFQYFCHMAPSYSCLVPKVTRFPRLGHSPGKNSPCSLPVLHILQLLLPSCIYYLALKPPLHHSQPWICSHLKTSLNFFFFFFFV